MIEQKPHLVIVGGSDVDARISLMQLLKGDFICSALGAAHLQAKFQENGFSYTKYLLTRGVNPLVDLVTVIRLMGIFKHIQPDIVHTFDTKPCVFARLAARLSGVPVIVGTVPGLGSLYVNEGIVIRIVRAIYEQLQKLACHLSDLTIFQHQEDARQFVTRGIVSAHKTTIIPGSGVRADLFNPDSISQAKREQVRAELGIPSDTVLVTMIARLIRSKGIIEFSTAAQAVCQRYPQTNFLLVGPTDEDSMDRLTPTELSQLARSVIQAGVRRDISAILAASDIFVLPSFYREGIPRVLLEAASMGLPLITTDWPGCKEVVKDGINGFLVPARDPDALTDAILSLVESPQKRQYFGQESRQYVKTHFDLSIIAEQTRSIYQELLSSKGLL